VNKQPKQLAVGVVDGVNTLFSTVSDYKPGSLVHFLNGFPQHSGMVELGGRDFQLTTAPLTGDVVSVYYRRI
jgi:hypothetical protein